MLKIDIITIFPEMFDGPFGYSMVKRGVEKGLVDIKVHNLRDWDMDNHKTVDDSPYSGGPGMVMKVDVIDRAIEALKTNSTKVVLLDTKGKMYNQKEAEKLVLEGHIILIAPHYEGIDHRVHEHLVDEVYSIGPYVLSGGEIPVMVVVDSVVRLIGGVLGNPESLVEESYSDDLPMEYPQYTRPEEYKGWKVPEVLLSGDPKKIREWRRGL